MKKRIKSSREYVIYCDRLKSYFYKATRLGILWDKQHKASTYPSKYKAQSVINLLQLSGVEIKKTR